MSILSGLNKDIVVLLKKDGTNIANIKASVQRNKIYMDASDLRIEPEDLILRTTSNGLEETYLVINPNFYENFHAIPAHYELEVKKLGIPEANKAIQNITYNITGNNNRLNQNSLDNSNNQDNSRHQSFNGTATNSNFNFGDNATLTNTVQQSQASDDVKQLLEQLLNEIKGLNGKIPDQAIQTLSEESETLITETTKEQPRKKYLDLSLEGIKEAALALGEIAAPILAIAEKLSPLLLG